MFLISTAGKTAQQISQEAWAAFQKFQRIYNKSLKNISGRIKLLPTDFVKLVEIKKGFEKKSLSFREKHVHKWEMADVPPQPGFGIFNSRIIKICSKCGGINQ